MQGSWQLGKAANARRFPLDDIVLVAGFADIDRAPDHKIVYCEHGAGQAYTQAHALGAQSYHGAEHPQRVIGYLSPRKEVAQRWGRPAFACGAPICDQFELVTWNTQPVACFCFHWDGSKVCPEAGTALNHYADRLPDAVAALRAEGFLVQATVHPRDPFCTSMWNRLGVELVDADEVRAHCDVIIADNTSLAYELAYLGRGVVSLNAPWYRRDHEHGLRFWSAVPGIAVDDADQLIDVIKHFGINLPVHAAAAPAAKAAYGRVFNDGHDGLRGATWLVTQFAK